MIGNIACVSVGTVAVGAREPPVVETDVGAAPDTSGVPGLVVVGTAVEGADTTPAVGTGSLLRTTATATPTTKTTASPAANR